MRSMAVTVVPMNFAGTATSEQGWFLQGGGGAGGVAGEGR